MKTIRMWVGDGPYPEGQVWATAPQCRTEKDIKSFISILQDYYNRGFHINVYSLGKGQLALLESLRRIINGLYADGLTDKVVIHLHEQDPQMEKFLKNLPTVDYMPVIRIK